MDRMSELADELLIKILMLVPTKVAVSTSILSKRWEYLWMWLPKLEYGHRQTSPSESKRLECFLERNLPLHRAPVIKTLRLHLDSDFKSENIKMWVVI
uniref:FBD-associated F-box protein n=2 Tax=Noccaea caerulescens TaxID=107243 RepID=A0A1J3HYG2_NOCCA